MKQRNMLQNAKWIIGCKIIQSFVQFIVGMLSARYFGPANYGLINYAASIVAIAEPIMTLGFSHTLVQEYVENPEKEGQIIGTHLIMNLISALACIIGVVTFVAFANPGDTITIIVCALYSISLISQALEMLQYWFQAKLLSQYSSMAMLVAYIVLSIYKICLLISGKSVYWFALSHTVEFAVAGIIMLIAYHKFGTQKLSVSVDLIKELYSKSKHYILAMLMAVVYNRISSIMLMQTYGEVETGFYAAAHTCTWIVGFVFTAIIDTARPVVLASRKYSQETFKINISRLYSLITWLSIAQSVGFAVFAGLIIRILYGADYLPAVLVLRILVWRTAFSYMSYVRNIWILGEKKHSVLWIINLCGAAVSILLNAVLIPLWGACGAALASVMTQIFTNFIFGFIWKPIRENNRLILKGMDPRLLLDMAKLLKNK